MVTESVDPAGNTTTIPLINLKTGKRRLQPQARLCSAHAGLGYTQARYDQVKRESNHKNITLGQARSIILGSSSSKEQDTQLIKAYQWSFDANRNLQVGFRGITVTQQQKNLIQNSVDIQFGLGLVKVN